MGKRTGSGQAEGSLGILDGWSIGTGAMMGVSVFVVSGTVSGIAGPAASLGYFLASLVALVVALCYSEIATAFPDVGGAYIYPRKVMKDSLGNLLSFVSGWSIYGGQGVGSSIVAVYTAEYINWTLELLGFHNPIPVKLMALCFIVAYALLNMKSMTGGKIFQIVSTVVIAGVMLVYCLWGGNYVDAAKFADFNPNGMNALFLATATALMSYGAWSVIPSMGKAFRKPSRDIPMSMLLSLLTCGGVFAVFVLVMNGLASPEELAASPTPSADALLAHNKYGALLIAIGGIFACVSSSNAHVMTSSRIPYSMSLDGFLPSVLSKENKKGIPYMAILFLMCCQIVVAFGGALELVVQMVVFVTSVSWTITLICVAVLRIRYPEVKPPFRMPMYPFTLITAFGILVFIMTRFTVQAMIIGIVWILIGISLFLLFTKTPLKRYCKKVSTD